MLFTLDLYEHTMIDFRILLSTALLSALVGYIIMNRHYKNLYNSGIFFAAMQSLLSFGFISCYLFLAINFYGSHNELRNYEFEIQEKSSAPGRKRHRNERTPIVRFDYFGFEKKLTFKYNETEKVNSSSQVVLQIKNGRLGYDVIESFYVK